MTLQHLLRALGALILVALLPGTVRADNPVNGAALYSAHCATNCHGSTPLTSNSNKIYNGRNSRSAIDTAIGNVGDMNSLRTTFASGSADLADIAAYLGNTPTSLAFASTAVGSTSAAQNVTVYASLKSGKSISALVVATSGDFARSGGTCGTALATGTSCTVSVTFTPTASGARTGTLSLAHSQTLTPITIALGGTGAAGAPTAPVASVTPASLTLAATALGATSAAQNVTLSNSGNAPLSVSSITFSNPDFIAAGGTCAAPASLAAGASCTVSVAFRPTAGSAGARSGALSIAHNAAGSPGTVALSGNATAAAAPLASLTASLTFGSVNVGSPGAAQTATLSNTGNAALGIASISTGSTEFTVSGGTCAAGGSVAAGSSCTIALAFTPSVAGARSATLTVTHNAGSGSSSSTLSGSGVALSPVIGVSPASLTFSQTVGSASAAQTVTVSNSGTAALVLNTLTFSGAQASEFQLGSGTTCSAGGSVAASSACLLRVTFTPAAAGARSASLAIGHNAGGTPVSVALAGTGTATPQPAVALNAAGLTFAAQTVGTPSASQTVTVSNSGAAPLTFSALSLAGAAAGDFGRGGSCTPTGTLAAGASCTIAFTFTPAAIGTRTATLTIASDASNGSAVLSLAGTGAVVATPAATLTPASLAFGNQTVGTVSSVRTATLTNSGSGALSIAGISASAGFGVSHGCGASLAAGATCTLSISFAPAAGGAASGSVSVASNALGSPHTVSLTGSGVAASSVLAWSPAVTALAFGDVTVGGSPSLQTLALRNQGPGAVTLQQFTVAGAQAADFALSGGGNCAANLVLAQGAGCTLAIAFQPGAVGARAGTLQVASSGSNPPDLALSGNGGAAAQPAVSVAPPTLDFTVTGSSSAADPQTLTLHSGGNAVLRVTALGVASGSFTLAPAAASGCPAVPFDLLPGQGCALAVAWSSTATGSESGRIEITTNAAATPQVVSVNAVREKPASVAGAAMTNVGAGGCSIARGDSPTDPTLWLLVAMAAAVLWRRGRRPAQACLPSHPAQPGNDPT